MNIVNNCSDYTLVGILSVIRKILELIQIIGPILLMISLTITFTRIVVNPEEKKYIKRIKNSILATFIIFFIPTIVNVVFGMLGETTNISSCWLKTEVKQTNSYIPIEEEDRQPIIPDPESYEKGSSIKQFIL